jgi:hypothetical protein
MNKPDLVALGHDAHKHWRDQPVGRIAVTVELANNNDLEDARRGIIQADQVRRIGLNGVSDTGATRLVLPQTVVQQLGVPVIRQVRTKYANGNRAIRDLVDGVWLGYAIPGSQQVRSGVFKAIVEPARTDALIGAIVLEDLDLVPDWDNSTLVPRDPDMYLAEIGW